MFERHQPPATDPIVRTMIAFAKDPRPEKIDLGIGVYRTPAGHTPVMRAVKKAERRLIETQNSKGYVALSGDPAFHAAMGDLVLGDAVPEARLAALATPGGTGAVRQAFDLVRMVRPGATIWIPDPTWPIHEAILDTLGLRRRSYRYYRPDTGAVDAEAMLADLAAVAAGDVVLLHGCCHNPTGADLSLSDWQALSALLARQGAVAMVDLAYQGFGTGLDEDAAGLRRLFEDLPEVLIAVSASKNFGLYRDRVGLLLALCDTPRTARAVQGSLASLNRHAYAFPPDHGARVVTEILTDPHLRQDWQSELAEMRDRVIAMRRGLADALREETGSDTYDWLRRQNGLFSRLSLAPEQVERLRRDHALYVVGDGRINLAGLTPATLGATARALAALPA